MSTPRTRQAATSVAVTPCGLRPERLCQSPSFFFGRDAPCCPRRHGEGTGAPPSPRHALRRSQALRARGFALPPFLRPLYTPPLARGTEPPRPRSQEGLRHVPGKESFMSLQTRPYIGINTD